MPESVPSRVLSDRRASPDGGEHFHNYVAGQVYAGGTVPPMSADLAAEALREGWGERSDGAKDSSRVQVHVPARGDPKQTSLIWLSTDVTVCCGSSPQSDFIGIIKARFNA